MWNQWPQYAGAPPLPTTAPPPPPQEPAGGTSPAPMIGPMLPSAVVGSTLPTSSLPAAPTAAVGDTAMPTALGANPYSQYTSAQYAAMTPEQQYALQQHWQQWQKYQEEYAKWHAQYGEQYKREMELAQKATTATSAIPTAAVASGYSSSYYPQPPPSTSNKITGQPQLYTQPPPPQVSVPSTGTSNIVNYSPFGAPPPAPPTQQQTSWQPPNQLPSYNQPPPHFNQQNTNANNSYMSAQQFQQPHFAGGDQQIVPGKNPDNYQYNNRNDSGPSSWQGPQNNRSSDNFSSNRAGNRGNGPPNNWNSSQGSVNRNFGYNNSGDGDSSERFNVAPTVRNKPIENENANEDNEEPMNSGSNNREEIYQSGPVANDRNCGKNNWTDGPNERNFGQNNWGPNNNRGPNNWNQASNNNRGPSNRNEGPNSRGPNNWNERPNDRGPNNRNERGTSSWNSGPNNRGPNNWNEDSNNRGPNNWNDGPNNRNNINNWNDRTTNDRNIGSNNRGPNNWNDCSKSNDRANSGRGLRGSDTVENDAENISGRNDGPNKRGGPGPAVSSGPGKSGRITDLDEEMFDRQFRLWEQQFEDWKKANANHPDKEMYKRYEQEFEKQRKRIAERREQMRRRKLEQMGIDPNQPPPQPSPDRRRTESVSNENADNGDSASRKRNDSIGSHQSFSSKQNQEQEVVSEIPKQNVKDNEPPIDNTKSEYDVKMLNDEATKTATNNETPQQNKNTDTPLGKRKSRFDTPTQAIKIKPIETAEVISLDDDDTDTEKVCDNKGNMSEIFKKVDGIPGLDLTDDTSSAVQIGASAMDESSPKQETKVDQNIIANKNQTTTGATPNKIPSLFDIKVDKPDMTDINDAKGQTATPASSTALPDLAKTLNDPDFLKKISEAVAQAKGTDGGQLSFSEWQQRKQGADNKPKDGSVDHDNSNSKESFRDKGSNRSEAGDDLNSNFSAHSGGGRDFPNNMVRNNNFGPDNDFCNNNWGPNNNGPNNWGRNNWGSNGNNIWAPNNGPNNSGPNGPNNNFGPNGPNNWGPNGPNNWGPNGSNKNFGNNGRNNNFGNNGPNNNFGNNGPNNNFGNNGPNNNFGNNGPNNNFGPNGPNNNFGPNGPNSNFGPNGPNSNFGPNGPNSNFGPNGRNNNFGPNGPNNNFGPNNWGPGGSNNWGPNGPNDFGPNNNFRGGNNRSFGGPNDGNGRDFRRNDGPGPNFGRNAPNFGSNDSRNFGRSGQDFGPNDGANRNFGSDGRGRNFSRDGSTEGFGDNFNRGGPDGNRRNRSRGGSNDRRDGSKNRSNSLNNKRDDSNNRSNTSKDGNNSDDTGTVNRNINNPFRRSDATKAVNLGENDGFNSKDQSETWNKGPDDRDNLDYGDYYRPVQVIDYSNSNATPTTTITPKVIDYGHKPVMNDDSSAFKPLKIINYDHASKAKIPPQQQSNSNAAQKRRKRKNKTQQQRQQYQQQQQQQQKQQQQKQTDLPKSFSAESNQEKDLQEQNKVFDAVKDQDDQLEEISDVEDIPDEPQSPPPPPPPMFSSSETFTQFTSQEFPSSIFPSTSGANENIPKMSSTHVQMSIPTVENNNTISIDEILMKPGRLTRPQKICMILRGPPGSGKSHVAKLIKEKENEMGGTNPRILSIDDYFLIENDYVEKCPKTGKKIPKKEILYEYDKDMEEKYLEYLIKSFKKSVADNFYDFIVIDCNNNSLRSLNEFYCHSKDSGFVPYIIDLFCDLETCLERNIHERSERDIKEIINSWKPTPGHYIKLDISSLLQNVIEMEDAEDMIVDDNTVSESAADTTMTTANDQNVADDQENEDDVDGDGVDNYNEDNVDDNDEDDSNDSISKCGFLKSKWETDTTTENLARLDGTSKLGTKRKPTMEEYLQMDEWQPPADTKGQKRVRWADIEEKREQEKMRAVGFVVGQTDWKRMMDPNAAKRALNKTKYIERVNKRR